MAGNKKNKRKPGGKRVHTFISKQALPIIYRSAPEDEQLLKIMPHTDMADMREGRGSEQGYWTITNRINWASVLATMVEFSFDPGPTLNAGLEALMTLHARFRQIGKYVLKAEEMKAIGEALTLTDDMADATTRRQHRDALVKLYEQLDKKEKPHV